MRVLLIDANGLQGFAAPEPAQSSLRMTNASFAVPRDAAASGTPRPEAGGRLAHALPSFLLEKENLKEVA